MEWFERVGFKKNDLLASSDVGYHQKIAGNIVSLYLLGKDDRFNPGKWYCTVQGSSMCANECADTKEDAFIGALMKFRSSLENSRKHLDERILEISKKIDNA